MRFTATRHIAGGGFTLAGRVAFADTLTPQSPVVFSFTPDAPGVWRISAGLFDHSLLMAGLSCDLVS